MPTILIVEDDPMIVEMLTALLQMEGYTVISASHGIEGLAQLQHHTVDLVLSDIYMPERDGVAFYRHLRADPAYQALPFIFMSALPPRQLTTSDSHMGLLLKPLELNSLLSTITRMLNQKQAESERRST